MRRRALLVSGGINPEKDYPRYERNIAAYYQILRERYGYASEDVRVCMSAGRARNIGSGGELVRVEPASRARVLDALQWLAELGEGDLAFLMVTDHGDEYGISLWGKAQTLGPVDFMAALTPCRATKVLVFGHCYAGIFKLAAMPPHTVLCCACRASEYALARPVPEGVEPEYSEFLYQLAGALSGVYPDGRPLNPRDELPPPDQVSLRQAFDYAQANDCWVAQTSRASSELPFMHDPEGLAESLVLAPWDAR